MKSEKYQNLRRILEKLRKELNGEIYLQDINKYLGNGPYQKIHKLKKNENKYQWIKSGRKPKEKKNLESRLDKIKKEISEEDLNFEKLKSEYIKLCDKYREDLSRSDLNQGKKELRTLYEKIRFYERKELNNKKISFLPGRWKKKI
jgi:hypothetical protein